MSSHLEFLGAWTRGNTTYFRPPEVISELNLFVFDRFSRPLPMAASWVLFPVRGIKSNSFLLFFVVLEHT